MTEVKEKRNYLRRALGGALCASPLAFAAVSACWPMTVGPTRHAIGIGLIIVSCIVAGYDFHLSFVRPRLWLWRYGTMDAFRFVSGLPMLGAMFQIAGCAVGFGSLPVGLAGLASALLDTAGPLWFALATWKDTSLWDE